MSSRLRSKNSEEHTKDRESLYQSLYDNIPVGIFRSDPEGRILSTNPALVKMLGYTSEKELSKKLVFDTYLVPEEGRWIRELLNKQGSVSDFETQLKRKDGSILWVSINAFAVSGDEAEVMYYDGVIQDITERRNAEEALRESEEQYRSMIDSMGEAIHVVDRNLRITVLNPAFRNWIQILDLEKNVVGKTVFEVFPFLTDRVRAEYEQVFLTGQTFISEDTNNVGGKEIITETRKIPVFEKDKVIRIVTVIADVTDRKRAQEALEESEQKYRSVVERANEGIAIVQDEKIKYSNPRLVRMLEYEDENALLDSKVAKHIHPDSRKAVMKRYRERILGAEVIPLYESALLTKSGKRIEVELSSELITYQGAPAVLVLIRDITERKLAEAALKLSQERYRAVSELTSDFAYSFVLLPDGKLIPEWITEAFNRITGIDANEIDSIEDLAKVIHPADRPLLNENLKALVTGEPVTGEYRVIDRKGIIRYLFNSATPVKDEKGSVVRVYGAAQDITDRKLAETALRFRTGFQNLIANISTSFVNLPIDDIDKGIDKALRTIGEFAGVDRSYVFRLHNNSTMMSNTHEWCAEGIEPQIENLKSLSLDSFPWFSAKLRNLETVYCPRVSELPGRAQAERGEWEREGIKSLVNVPMLLEGRVVGFIGFDSVHTEKEWPDEILSLLRIVGETFASALERKRAEEQIRDRETRYSALFENAGDAIMLLKDGKVIDCNSKTLELFGCTRNQIKSLYPDRFSPEFQPDGTASIELEQMKIESTMKGRPQRFYWQHLRLNGTPFDAEVTLNRVDVGDSVILQAIIRDITEQKKAEKALSESEERYRGLTEEALVGIYIYSNNQRKYLFVNPEMSRITGYSYDELLEIDPNEFPVAEDLHILKEREDAVRHGQLIDPEYTIRIRRKDGSRAVLSVRTHRIQYRGEQVALGNCIDVTELTMQREQIERAKQEWERTFDSIDDHVYIIDNNLRIIRANAAAARYLGVSFEEMVGKPCYEFFRREGICQTGKCPHYQTIASKTTVHSEFNDAKTGRIFSVSASPVFETSGETMAVVEVARDITDMRKMEDALAASENKFRSMAESVRDIIFTVSYSGAITYISPGAREILGEEPEVFTGRNLLSSTSRVFNKETRGIISKFIKTSSGERIPPFEIEARDKQGRRHILEVVARRLENQVVGVARDITDRKAMEQQLLRASKLASIGVLAAGIAHQVNNPLAIILSASTVLRDIYERHPDFPRESKIKAAKYCDMLENQVERTRRVVSGLLAFAQEKRLNLSKTEINPLLRESLQLLVQYFGEGKVLLELSLGDDLPQVFVDQASLQQVIINLVQNAIEAMKGKGVLKISTMKGADKNVQIVFSDSGPGVPQTLREEIFEPLFTTKATSKGTGLGLPLSVMLLERFGGRVYLAETSKEGATFVVEMPAAGQGK